MSTEIVFTPKVSMSDMSSPTPSIDTASSSGSISSDGELDQVQDLNTKCSQCHDTFTSPKVLACFHTFCQPCLENNLLSPDKVQCPTCQTDTFLSSAGVAGLLTDFAISNILKAKALDSSNPHCTGCSSKDTDAVARCLDCANFLCSNCVMAHQFMHCFEGHRVMSLSELQNSKESETLQQISEKPLNCTKHSGEVLCFFCRTCDQPICQECTLLEHSTGHDYDYLSKVCTQEVEHMQRLSEQAKVEAKKLKDLAKNTERSSNKLNIHFNQAQNEINDTYNVYLSLLEKRKLEAIDELDAVYNSKKTTLNSVCTRTQKCTDQLDNSCVFMEKIFKYCSSTETLIFKKNLDCLLKKIISYTPEIQLPNDCDIQFVSNHQAIQVGICNTFGYVRQIPTTQQTHPQPIARPKSGFYRNSVSSSAVGGPTKNLVQNTPSLAKENNVFSANSLLSSKNHFPSSSSLISNDTGVFTNPYETWANCGTDLFENGGDIFSTSTDHVIDITSKWITDNMQPPKSQIQRQKMIYHCKFGEFGIMEGQFTEPSGVAVNAQNDIIVADTNNHRIQIFDREGRFKLQFGEFGKRDGQLSYPNRVAVFKATGDIVVTERSPTHQVQIYNQYGQFIRKFGASILQHPRGVTVDSKGRIIIVECKVMRVVIFDQFGNILYTLGFSRHLEFPNGVVVNDKEEIFISDNRAHCVKVFNYQGVFLRQIGGEGITNYPIGVGINAAGEILIADNHNNLHLTSFTQDGHFINALESKVKHAQCLDVSLADEGSVILASKDYRLYIYRYASLLSPSSLQLGFSDMKIYQ